jgi:hypothetical protein
MVIRLDGFTMSIPNEALEVFREAFITGRPLFMRTYVTDISDPREGESLRHTVTLRVSGRPQVGRRASDGR